MQMKNRRERTFFEWWNSIPTELKKNLIMTIIIIKIVKI
jgi:hypothetical protein